MWSRSLLRSCRGLRTVHGVQRSSSCILRAQFRGLHAETQADRCQSVDAPFHQFGIEDVLRQHDSSDAKSLPHAKDLATQSDLSQCSGHSDAHNLGTHVKSADNLLQYDVTGFRVKEKEHGEGVKFQLYASFENRSGS